MNSIKQAIILALTSDKYSEEFSDIGSLIGEAIAANSTGEECYTVNDFLYGFKHGVSLVDGTHDEPLNNQKYLSTLESSMVDKYKLGDVLIINTNEGSFEIVKVIDKCSNGALFCAGENFEGWVPIIIHKTKSND